MDEILIILRALIQDIDGSTYTNDQLNRLILTSSIIIQKEVYFETTYVPDLVNLTLTPDPTDNAFILLCAYKSAIFLVQSEMRKYASHSFKIVDGPSSVDMSSVVSNYKTLLDSLIDQYNKMIKDYTLTQNEGAQFGYAVITPTTCEYVSPSNF